MYLPLDQLPPLSGNQFYYHEITGMKLMDDTFGEIGTVSEVLEYSNQAIIQTFYKIIHHVDRENNTLHLNLPEGLLDVYLDV